ncbi:MAG: PilZ domain-containing protein [Nannocystaceae bacterium]
MSAALQLDPNRRQNDRIDVVLPVRVDGTAQGRSANLSFGGACVEIEGAAPAVGSAVTLAFDVHGRTIEVHSEVRWAKPGARPTIGVMFRRGHRALVAALVAGLVGAGAATASASTTTNVPTFDPNADVELDMNAGPERPDKQQVLDAFSRQYDAIDACVVDTKRDPDKPLQGEAHVEVLLNPTGEVPLGVNTELPKSLAKNRQLRECLRAAVATADYPSYDGPPIVVEFDFEIDPGYEEEPAE